MKEADRILCRWRHVGAGREEYVGSDVVIITLLLYLRILLYRGLLLSLRIPSPLFVGRQRHYFATWLAGDSSVLCRSS